MEWLIAAGLHPRANATTLTIAHDLAARMDYDTGHVRYCLDGMPARLGVSRASVKRHVAYLRELGALAWVVHGTKTNIRRTLGMKGYAGTATVYAAVIPAVYDDAMGHRIVGSGYNARIVVDLHSQQEKAVDNSSATEACAPPSLTVVKEERQVKVEGGFEDTSRERASREPTTLPLQKTRSNRTGRRPMQVATDIRIARRVRALVNWTQIEGLRRLAYSLRPLIDRGLDGDQIASELHGMCLAWRPSRPAAYIATALARQAEQDAEHAAADKRLADQTWRAAAAQAAADQASLEALFAPLTTRYRTDNDRRAARLDWSIWPEVAEHYADDPDDAIDLYGPRLVTYAIRQDARLNGHREVTHV